MGEGDGTPEQGEQAAEPLVCDFCGAATPHVRRIALDRDYDRLQVPHQVRYACDACSAEKERQRLAAERG